MNSKDCGQSTPDIDDLRTDIASLAKLSSTALRAVGGQMESLEEAASWAQKKISKLSWYIFILQLSQIAILVAIILLM